MSEKDGERQFRIIPYAPGYGVVIWYGAAPYKDEKYLHLSDTEFVALDRAIHDHAEQIRTRVVSEWLMAARSTEGGET